MVALNSTFTFLFSSFTYFYGGSDLVVSTKYGQLEGTTAESRNGRSFYEFLGIPYAKPPVGELRFEPPVPPDPWDGVKSTTSIGYECLQIRIGIGRQGGAEDCLFLNVHTHQIQKISSQEPITELHPVIVYIHGGIFMFGGSRIYGARYFMDHDVVLVVMQYRLGALGFLNTGDGRIRGNMALKDQSLALTWVQENIQMFGGDPNRVTLVGQSAGAVCAHLHMLSPMSRGLFQQIVTQSGNALSPWGLKEKPVEQAMRFAQKVNCPVNSTSDMVQCLKNMDASDLVQGHSDYPYQLYDQLVIFGPTVETVNDSNTFLDEKPAILMKTDRSMLIPWLSGVNSEEGLIFAAKMLTNETMRALLSSNWTEYAPRFLGLDDHPRKAQLVQEIRQYYFGLNPELSLEGHLQPLVQLLSDRNFFESTHDLAVWFHEQGNYVDRDPDLDADLPPMYLYYYAYKGEFSLGNFVLGMTRLFPQTMDAVISTGLQWISTNVFGRQPHHYGAGHADEIFLMFKLPILTQHENGTKDFLMSRKIVDIWASFARDRRPSGITNDDDTNQCWLPVGQYCPRNQTADTVTEISPGSFPLSLQYMKLDNVSYNIDEPYRNRLEFWRSLNLNSGI